MSATKFHTHTHKNIKYTKTRGLLVHLHVQSVWLTRFVMTVMWQDIIKMACTCIPEVPWNSVAKNGHGWGTWLPDSDSCLPLPLIHSNCAPLWTWSSLRTNLSSTHSERSGGTGLPLLISACRLSSSVLHTWTQFQWKGHRHREDH
jgi:hypothetical protein